MKKLLLLLAFMPLLLVSSCDNDKSDPAPVNKNYLSDLNSAQNGILGRWRNDAGDRSFDVADNVCYGTAAAQTLGSCAKYSLTVEGGVFYLNTFAVGVSSGSVKEEVMALTETQLRLRVLATNATLVYSRVTTQGGGTPVQP